ncbi:hypothetical protein V6N13_013217 [Hibiscus sabdariffa]
MSRNITSDDAVMAAWLSISLVIYMFRICIRPFIFKVFMYDACHGFAAETLGFPFLPPYYGCKNGGREGFRKGANFAVAGATALSSSFLAEMGIHNPTTNMSLGDQLSSFNDFLPPLCSSSSGKAP